MAANDEARKTEDGGPKTEDGMSVFVGRYDDEIEDRSRPGRADAKSGGEHLQEVIFIPAGP
jgi:hypothetical protein